MKSKVKVHEFDPVIYPVKLWVVNQDVYHKFEHLDGSPLNSFVSDTSICSSYNRCIMRKCSKNYGFLVTIQKINDLQVSNIAHEAAHIARFMWEHLGEEYTGKEADAYLIGWIAGCIEKVKLGKT
jgi:hypothetical protein